MKILKSVYLKILGSYPVPPPEQGGILGIKNGIVCEYYHDGSCNIADRAVYEPDVDTLNRKIEEWDAQGISFGGIVHSHLSGQNTLSAEDKKYIELLLGTLNGQTLYFPIVIPSAEQVISYVAERKSGDIIIRQDEIHMV